MKITDGTRQRALVAMEALDDRLAESSNDVAIISRQKQKFIVAMERAFYFFFAFFFLHFFRENFSVLRWQRATRISSDEREEKVSASERGKRREVGRELNFQRTKGKSILSSGRRNLISVRTPFN